MVGLIYMLVVRDLQLFSYSLMDIYKLCFNLKLDIRVI